MGLQPLWPKVDQIPIHRHRTQPGNHLIQHLGHGGLHQEIILQHDTQISIALQKPAGTFEMAEIAADLTAGQIPPQMRKRRLRIIIRKLIKIEDATVDCGNAGEGQIGRLQLLRCSFKPVC